VTAKPCFRLPSDNLPPARLRTDMRRPATVMSKAKTGTWEPCGHVDAQEEHMTFMLEKSQYIYMYIYIYAYLGKL